ncbi:hypothetical protein ACXIZN_15680 [Amycolatopsis sp. TRM77291]
MNTDAQLNEVLDAIRLVTGLANNGGAADAYLKAYERLGDRLASLAD